MTISIPQRKAPSAEAIDDLKKLFPSGIPKDYFDFLLNHDGASLKNNMLGPDDEYSVRKFISAKNIPKEKRSIAEFPKFATPIAEYDCGNYFYINKIEGKIYFWDHELEDGDVFLADSFNGFLEIIDEDNSVVEINPGQIISVWTDPTFKPNFDNDDD